MTENGIRIGKSNYYLKSDRQCWTVSRRVKCQKAKSFPDGFKFADYSYHSTLSDAFKRIFDETVKLSEYESIQDLLRIVDETHQMLKEILDRDFDGK